MFINTIKKLEEESYLKGFVDGFAEVIAERYFKEIEETKIAIADKLLHHGFDVPFVVQVTDLSEEEVLKLKANLERKH